jgi:hypothetical protein
VRRIWKGLAPPSKPSASIRKRPAISRSAVSARSAASSISPPANSETAIGLDGGFAQAHFGLGQAYAAAGDRQRLGTASDRAIGLDPHDPHSWTFYHDRAEACFALGHLAEAERFSRIAVGLPNASHFAHATLVAIMGASRKSDGTATAIARLRRMKPDYALAAAAEELGHHANQSFVGEYLAGLTRAGLAA